MSGERKVRPRDEAADSADDVKTGDSRWRRLHETLNKKARAAAAEDVKEGGGGVGEPVEEDDMKLNIPRVHRRRWVRGYEMDVEAKDATDALSKSQPAKFMSARDVEKYLNSPRDDAKLQADDEVGRGEASDKKKSDTPVSSKASSSGIGIGMEYDDDEAACDEDLETERKRLSNYNEDPSNKYTSAHSDVAYKSKRDKEAARRDITLEDDFKKLTICHVSAELATPRRFATRRSIYVEKPVSPVPQGELRFQAIFECGYLIAKANSGPLSTMQQSYYEMCMVACAPLIYGEDWFTCKEDFLARFGITKINFLVAALTPRQFGKTTVVAVVATALGLHMLKIEIAIFAVGLDAAKRLLLRVKEYLRIFLGHGARDRIGIDSSVEISIISAEDQKSCATRQDRINQPNHVLIKSLPATEKGMQ